MNRCDKKYDFFHHAVCHFFGFSPNLTDTEKSLPHPWWNITYNEADRFLFEFVAHDYQQIIPQVDTRFSISTQNSTRHFDNLFDKMTTISLQRSHDVPFATLPKVVCHYDSDRPVVIGLHARKRQGKSTVAKFLEEEYLYVEFSFADALKRGVASLFSLPWSTLDYNKETVNEIWNVTPRYLLQKIGTELFRDRIRTYLPTIRLQKGFWLDHFLMRKQQLEHKIGHVVRMVVSDARFVDECQLIREAGGVVWYLERDVNQAAGVDAHASETNIQAEHADVCIRNDGDVEDLYDKVHQHMLAYAKGGTLV